VRTAVNRTNMNNPFQLITIINICWRL